MRSFYELALSRRSRLAGALACLAVPSLAAALPWDDDSDGSSSPSAEIAAPYEDAKPALAKGKALLLSGLNRKLGDAVTLSATVDSVAVKGLFVTRDGVLLRAEAIGQARVAVKQQ